MSIISKFTIATEEGLRTLFQLREAQIRDMYTSMLEEASLKAYITQQLDHKETILELNDLSTQMLTVYQDDTPAGYVMIKQVDQPEILAGKKVINLASLYFLPAYDQNEVRQSLWTKIVSLTRQYDAIWLEVLPQDPITPHLLTWGFEKQEEQTTGPFGQASSLFIRWKEEV
ncbi:MULTISPECIES: GNAT family N-acetyltransferase [unclassified Myroides]|uniref:GNAT family N-acetyltransferase n=1 Tax=unclassified Myroides TaxID=2642485 RepID=UPI003D2F6F92